MSQKNGPAKEPGVSGVSENRLNGGTSDARRSSLRIGYADPPYPGCAKLYKDHPDYGGEVDHAQLVRRLEADYDGWVLHTSSVALADVLALCPKGVRVMAWVKPFAAFKRNVSVAYAWEPVIVKACP